MLPKIVPAILTSDIKDLKTKLEKLNGLSDWVQIDILDGKFINNKTIELKDLGKIKRVKKFNLEAHLMVENPEKYFKECQKLKIKRVIFHQEASRNLREILSESEKFKFKTGIALNPRTPITKIKPYLNQIDLVLLMGVNPGFQGQKFIPSVLNKIKNLKKMASEKRKVRLGRTLYENAHTNINPVRNSEGSQRKISNGVKIEIDGGVNISNIKKVVEAGADYLVIGSSLFKNDNVRENLRQLKKAYE